MKKSIMRANGEKWSNEVHEAMDIDVVKRAIKLMESSVEEDISFDQALKIIQIVGIEELGDLVGDLVFTLEK